MTTLAPQATRAPGSGPARGIGPLPALAHHVDRFPCPPVSLVMVTHVLDTAVPFVEAVSQAVHLEAIVGIPYSAMPTAHEQLSGQGHRVVVPDDIADLPAVARAEIGRATATHPELPVVVQEIGGYCAPLVDELRLNGGLAGIVEDTKQGHWRYAERDSLPLPVLSIAESPLKELENQQVGRSISHALETILRRRFHRLATETRVGVMGYGGVGEATVGALSAVGARVDAFDVCGIRMAKAALDGFADASREQVVAESDVLLGVSGHRSLGGEDFARARPGAILASGSSKRIEIDLEALERDAEPIGELDLVREYRLDGKPLFLLNDGMPINFLEQSVLGRVLDLVYTELYMCVREIARGDAGPGLGSLDVARQREIAQTWRRLHWA